jgi:hypothetical protein
VSGLGWAGRGCAGGHRPVLQFKALRRSSPGRLRHVLAPALWLVLSMGWSSPTASPNAWDHVHVSGRNLGAFIMQSMRSVVPKNARGSSRVLIKMRRTNSGNSVPQPPSPGMALGTIQSGSSSRWEPCSFCIGSPRAWSINTD